ncbi:MAG: 4-alpha-glucanotransferase [bacterium]
MVKFLLHCNTEFGQNLFVEIANGDIYTMRYINDGLWACEIEIAEKSEIKYTYYLEEADGTKRYDAQKNRVVPKHKNGLVVEDTYIYNDILTLFNTAPFTKCLMCQAKIKPIPVIKEDEMMIILFAPGVEKNESVALIGDGDFLGNWDQSKMVNLTPSSNCMWWLKVPADSNISGREYKYIIYSKDDKTKVRWESGENRRFVYVVGNKLLTNTIRVDFTWKAHGVAIPVFSLRSDDNWGVGEFYTLRKMCDWAVEREQKIIQILPINDTTSTLTELDSYPYKANSVNALHPMYLNMKALGELKDKGLYKKFLKRGEELNRLDNVDYVAVNELKNEYAFAKFTEDYKDIISDKDFKKFVKDNASWIVDYAVYSSLRDDFGSDDTTLWGGYSTYNAKEVRKYAKQYLEKISFYYYLQFNLDKQLIQTVEYLHNNGVVLKGDLPIGISARSVDAWVNPQLFNLDKQAGAPPDDFSVNGQNWGFPTYNWTEMEKDGFKWWKNRFDNMSKYFDAFRIDHILGFFRIWEIPSHAVLGLLGYFNPTMPLSVTEIEHNGIYFDRDRYINPYITKERLDTLFATDSNAIAAKYFHQKAFDKYEFKPEFNTQKALVDFFTVNNMLPTQQGELDKLLSLYCEVIFIEDSYHHNYFHPRINVYQSYSYSTLSDHEKNVIKSIHNDYFYRRHLIQWEKEALRKMPPLVGRTDMLVCGEDLGMVPDCVASVMWQLKILSLEIERMPKQIDAEFVDQNKMPYLAVSSTGTHDTSTLRQWWKENSDVTQRYFDQLTVFSAGKAPTELTAKVATDIVNREIYNNSMLTILPWQDYMACDEEYIVNNADNERINDPSNPKHIWCWRMPITL